MKPPANAQSLQVVLQQAERLLAQGKAAAADQVLRQAMTIWPSEPDLITLLARAYEQAGRFSDAEKFYRHSLSIRPGQPQVLTQLAYMLSKQGRFPDAIAAYQSAISADPRNTPQAHHGLARGLALQAMERFDEALASFDKVLEVDPDNVLARNNRATALQSLKRYEDSVEDFRKVVARQPDYAPAWNGMGIAFQFMKRHDEALACFDKAVTLAENDAEAWNNRGVVLEHLKRFEEALNCYARALSIQPGHPGALVNLSILQGASGLVEESFALFLHNAEVEHGGTRTPLAGNGVLPHKLKHDREQQEYLNAIRVDPNAAEGLLSHFGDGGRAARAVNSSNANAALARKWKEDRPQIAVVDDFLTPEALEKLRRFCLESTIWHKTYNNGYLGALPEYGFACPLLAQIADEMRETFPEIFADHTLKYIWAFKYDSHLKGIEIHADEAAVNVNFWITPDEANLDPERGGLVVWDVAAPLDWNFDQFNGGDSRAIRKFLADNNAKSVTVPYRANRAVIFDSDLFHETDAIEFLDGYLNRRINVTLLFGRRK